MKRLKGVPVNKTDCLYKRERRNWKKPLVSSLSILVQYKMLADCDVDVPNLHILLKGEVLKKDDYFGAKEAVIDSSACIRCGLCRKTCRFGAINEEFEVNPMKCEGCGACLLVCPQEAICLEEVKTGETYVSETSRGTFSHALLDIGAEGSGKLVTFDIKVPPMLKDHPVIIYVFAFKLLYEGIELVCLTRLISCSKNVI